MTHPILKHNTTNSEAISVENAYTMLIEIASQCPSSDPYMNSPAYIAMTARKGLNIYKGQYADIIYAPHPNDFECCIIFSPLKSEGLVDVIHLAEDLKTTWPKIQLIRTPDDAASFRAIVLRGQDMSEDILDYKYPVHTLDVNRLIAMKGPKLYNFKKTLQKIDRSKTHSKNIDFAKDRDDILVILKQWAHEVSYNPDTNIAEPALYICETLSQHFPLEGEIVYLDNKPVGFYIWEKPISGFKTANAIIHCALHIQGLSELLHFEMAKSVRDNGFDKLCIGGAETDGLDAFKRKMQPISSIKLKTVTC